MLDGYVLLIFIGMFFFHIIDDFYLQLGILNNLKQKKWWDENAPDFLYRDDYLAALFIHGFSWSCMIHVPIIIAILILGLPFNYAIWFSIIINAIIHAYIDHLKANKYKINLCEDQFYHSVQIFFTFLILVGAFGVLA